MPETEDSGPEMPVLERFEALVGGFAPVLGVARPYVLSFAREPAAVAHMGGPSAFLWGRFLVGYVPGRHGRGVMFVNESLVARLSSAALAALAAHEMGHVADWLLSARLSLAGTLLGPFSGLVADDEGSLRPEVFANRVAAHLVGRTDVLALHAESARLLGGTDAVNARALDRMAALPERPTLPPSLRILPGRTRI